MAVLYAFIQQDSLMLSSHGPRSKSISSLALPLQVEPPPMHPLTLDEELTTPEGFAVGLKQLLAFKLHSTQFFTHQDSLFLLTQAQQQREQLLDITLFAPADLLPPEQQEQLPRGERNQEYYLFSQPVFSRDKTRAYFQMDHICHDACGSGLGYFLEKKAGRWRVVGNTLGWIA